MKKVAVIALKDCEEIETLFPVDILRRANIEVDILTYSDNYQVLGSHNILVKAVDMIDNVDFEKYDGIFLPGGPGSKNYEKIDKLKEILNKFNSQNKMIAAICAAPSFLAKLGILKNKKATVYKGFEDILIKNEAIYLNQKVVKDENIITGRSVAAACDISLEIVRYLLSEKDYEKIKEEIIYI